MISHRGISVITPLPFGGGAGGGANFLLIIFSFREKAEYATRGGPSTFKNMPFMPQEGRLLRARRAYTRTQNVTH